MVVGGGGGGGGGSCHKIFLGEHFYCIFALIVKKTKLGKKL